MAVQLRNRRLWTHAFVLTATGTALTATLIARQPARVTVTAADYARAEK
jgi:hypothetical protein